MITCQVREGHETLHYLSVRLSVVHCLLRSHKSKIAEGSGLMHSTECIAVTAICVYLLVYLLQMILMICYNGAGTTA